VVLPRGGGGPALFPFAGDAVLPLDVFAAGAVVVLPSPTPPNVGMELLFPPLLLPNPMSMSLMLTSRKPSPPPAPDCAALLIPWCAVPLRLGLFDRLLLEKGAKWAGEDERCDAGDPFLLLLDSSGVSGLDVADATPSDVVAPLSGFSGFSGRVFLSKI
jgi:hypothetical protein